MPTKKLELGAEEDCEDGGLNVVSPTEAEDDNGTAESDDSGT